jgi:hypothetical protein
MDAMKGRFSVQQDAEPLSLTGYEYLTTFRYPAKFVLVAKSPPYLLALALYQCAYWRVIGGNIFQEIGSVVAFLLVVVVMLSIDVVRGLIQRGACRLLGYHGSFYTIFFAPMEATFPVDTDQFYSRRDALLICLAPLCLFLLFCIPLLFFLPTIPGNILAFVLIINIAGTGWDIYFVGWLLRRPRDVMLFTENVHQLVIFKPEAGETRQA